MVKSIKSIWAGQGGLCMAFSLRRFLGFVFVLVSTVSLLVTTALVVQVWRYRLPVLEITVDSLDQWINMLSATQDAFLAVDGALSNANDTIKAIETSTLNIVKSLENASLTTSTFATFFGEDIRAAILTTQESLVAAQESALAIDTFLATLSQIPLLGVNYKPEVPLNNALNNVAIGLAPVGLSLQDVSSDLMVNSQDLNTLEEDIATISKSVGAFRENISLAQDATGQYQDQLTRLRSTLLSIRLNIANIINLLVWALTFMLAWIGIAQLSLWIQGLEYLRNRR
jgi:hypothetical protein